MPKEEQDSKEIICQNEECGHMWGNHKLPWLSESEDIPRNIPCAKCDCSNFKKSQD